MADVMGVEKTADHFAKVLSNKRTRSFVFLLASFLIILAINSFLPVIQGEAHYTAEAIEITYGEYKTLKAENNNYNLTWLTEKKMNLFKDKYIEEHPELTEEEAVLYEVPDVYPVKVYTKFFYQHPFWYISTLTSLGSAIILFYSLFNYLLTLTKDKYKKYVELEETLTKMSKNDLDPVTFEPWMDNVFNYNRKIQQHINNTKYELDKLEQRTKYKDKRRLKKYFNVEDAESKSIILNKLGSLTKKEQKYLNKKEELLSRLEDDYIKQYVVNGKVKYFKYIHPMFIYNGTNKTGHTVDSYSLINSDAKQIVSDAGLKVVLSLTVTVLFAVLFTVTAIASIEQSAFWIVVNIVSKLAPLLIQIPLAFDYNNKFTDNQLINNMLSRKAIGLRYLADMKAGVSIKPHEKQSIKADTKVTEEEVPKIEGGLVNA